MKLNNIVLKIDLEIMTNQYIFIIFPQWQIIVQI